MRLHQASTGGKKKLEHEIDAGPKSPYATTELSNNQGFSGAYGGAVCHTQGSNPRLADPRQGCHAGLEPQTSRQGPSLLCTHTFRPRLGQAGLTSKQIFHLDSHQQAVALPPPKHTAPLPPPLSNL